MCRGKESAAAMDRIEAARRLCSYLILILPARFRPLGHGVCNAALSGEENWPLLELAASKTVFCFYERRWLCAQING
jgi:hypothetical protein